MKLYLATILLTCLLACTQAYPGSTKESTDSNESVDKKDVETVLVLPSGNSGSSWNIPSIGDSSEFFNDDDYEDAYNPFSFNPFNSNPFDGLMTRMQDAMRKLREQMTGILSRIPEHDGVGPFGKIPEGANTTSTTKIVDGHVVTINETTYVDDNLGTVIRVRVVDVKPQNDTILMTESGIDKEVTTPIPDVTNIYDAEKENTTPERSVETVEDFDNEIPKNQGDLTA
ncbi:icarapin-like [Prorops nasuta]|uniref:icarapin-like n=1 Tax=Prorops nasuta TaxID=863751 RepID=UPI0034CD26AF